MSVILVLIITLILWVVFWFCAGILVSLFVTVLDFLRRLIFNKE